MSKPVIPSCLAPDPDAKFVLAIGVSTSVDQLFEALFVKRTLQDKVHMLRCDSQVLFTGWMPEADQLPPGTFHFDMPANVVLEPPSLKNRHRKFRFSAAATSMSKAFHNAEYQQLTEFCPGTRYYVEAVTNTSAMYGDKFTIHFRYLLLEEGPTACKFFIAYTIIFTTAVNGLLKPVIAKAIEGGVRGTFKIWRQVLDGAFSCQDVAAARWGDVYTAGRQANVKVVAHVKEPPKMLESTSSASVPHLGILSTFLSDHLVYPAQISKLIEVLQAGGFGPEQTRMLAFGVALGATLVLMSIFLGLLSLLSSVCTGTRGLAALVCLPSIVLDVPRNVNQVVTSVLLVAAVNVAIIWASKLLMGAIQPEADTMANTSRTEATTGVVQATAALPSTLSVQPAPPPPSSKISYMEVHAAPSTSSNNNTSNESPGFWNFFGSKGNAPSDHSGPEFTSSRVPRPPTSEHPAPRDPRPAPPAQQFTPAQLALVEQGKATSTPSSLQPDGSDSFLSNIMSGIKVQWSWNSQPGNTASSEAGSERDLRSPSPPPRTASLPPAGPSPLSQLMSPTQPPQSPIPARISHSNFAQFASSSPTQVAAVVTASNDAPYLNNWPQAPEPSSQAVMFETTEKTDSTSECIAVTAVGMESSTAPKVEPDEVEEEVFEHERFQPFRGWGHSWPGHFLPSDRVCHWGDRLAVETSSLFNSTTTYNRNTSMVWEDIEPPLPPGWMWLGARWQVDLTGVEQDCVDASGWSYAVDFNFLTYPPKPGFGLIIKSSFVRRRRWTRTRIRMAAFEQRVGKLENVVSSPPLSPPEQHPPQRLSMSLVSSPSSIRDAGDISSGLTSPPPTLRSPPAVTAKAFSAAFSIPKPKESEASQIFTLEMEEPEPTAAVDIPSRKNTETNHAALVSSIRPITTYVSNDPELLTNASSQEEASETPVIHWARNSTDPGETSNLRSFCSDPLHAVDNVDEVELDKGGTYKRRHARKPSRSCNGSPETESAFAMPSKWP